jgi:hypothetical protein
MRCTEIWHEELVHNTEEMERSEIMGREMKPRES